MQYKCCHSKYKFNIVVTSVIVILLQNSWIIDATNCLARWQCRIRGDLGEKWGYSHDQEIVLITSRSPQLPVPGRFILWWKKRQNKYLFTPIFFFDSDKISLADTDGLLRCITISIFCAGFQYSIWVAFKVRCVISLTKLELSVLQIFVMVTACWWLLDVCAMVIYSQVADH